MKLEQFESEYQEKEQEPSSTSIKPGEIVIGEFTGLNDQGEPMIRYLDQGLVEPIIAISTVALNQQQSGRRVAMLFAEGNPQKPVIVGLIHNPLADSLENFELIPAVLEDSEDARNENQNSAEDNEVSIDGKRVVIEGQEQIVFKCGEASITLTKAGKILIRGKYVLNRSTGVNRIQGGSVQVN